MAVQLPNVEWVLPQAYVFQTHLTLRSRYSIYHNPTRPVSSNAGQQCSSWFNIRSFPPDCNEWDEVAIASSVSHVEGWIQAEVHRGADPRRIILMGFSQGAALGLLVALTTLHDLGGVVSLAGWIPHKGREVSSHQKISIRQTLRQLPAANRPHKAILTDLLRARQERCHDTNLLLGGSHGISTRCPAPPDGLFDLQTV